MLPKQQQQQQPEQLQIQPYSGAEAPVGELTLEYEYLPEDDFDEAVQFLPIMMAWLAPSTRHGLHAMHRHRLRQLGAAGQRYAPVRVSFPYYTKKWSQDTCVRFELLTATRTSEGKLAYRKEASAVLYLADSLAQPVGVYTKLEMHVDNFYVPRPEDVRDPGRFERERRMGEIRVRRMSVHRKIEWLSPGPYDITPANEDDLTKMMMMAVTRVMSPFDKLRPTLPGETERIRAPLNMQAPLGLEGSSYFWLAPYVAAGHIQGVHGGYENTVKYYKRLIEQSLEEHDMPRSDFMRAGRVFAGEIPIGQSALNDRAIRKAAQVVATATTMRVVMMAYAADKVGLGGGYRGGKGQEPVVESFDTVDFRTGEARDEGGVHSTDIIIAPAAGRLTPRIGDRIADIDGDTDGSRELSMGGAMDCEDGARDAFVHFATLADEWVLPDAAIAGEPLLVSARAIARRHRMVSILTSVMSRNLSDAREQAVQESEGAPKIGSPADRNVQVGAHMVALMLPERTLRQNITRAMKMSHPPAERASLAMAAAAKVGRSPSVRQVRPLAKVDIGSYLPPVPSVPKQRTAVSGDPIAVARGLKSISEAHEWPLVCEGTGRLKPAQLPEEGYVHPSDSKGRMEAATISVLEQEAELRLRTGETSDELAQQQMRGHAGGRLRVDRSPELEKFVPMHGQTQMIFDDPERRVVPTFYRTASQGFLLPTGAQVEEMLRREKSRPPSQLACYQFIPVQIEGDSMTHGTAISYILRKDARVGFMPMPEPSAIEAKVVHRAYAHMPPMVPWHLDGGKDRYIAAAEKWAANFTKISGVPPISARRRRSDGGKRFVTTHGYANPRSLYRTDIAAIGAWLKGNPHVVGASLKLERSTEHLGTLRLDVLIDCGDTARESQQHIKTMMMAAPRRLSEFHESVVTRYSSSLSQV